MRIIDSASAITAGGACFLNKAQHRGPFIDTGIDNSQETPYGRICLSVVTVEHLARMIGWAPADEVEQLHEELAMARLALADATAKAERYGNVVEFLGEAAAELADAELATAGES